jgi:hypothetical protein
MQQLGFFSSLVACVSESCCSGLLVLAAAWCVAGAWLLLGRCRASLQQAGTAAPDSGSTHLPNPTASALQLAAGVCGSQQAEGRPGAGDTPRNHAERGPPLIRPCLRSCGPSPPGRCLSSEHCGSVRLSESTTQDGGLGCKPAGTTGCPCTGTLWAKRCDNRPHSRCCRWIEG